MDNRTARAGIRTAIFSWPWGSYALIVPLYVPQKWFDMHPLEGIEVPPYQPDDLNDVPPVALKINDLPMMPSTEWAIENGEWKNIIQAYLACVSFVITRSAG